MPQTIDSQIQNADTDLHSAENEPLAPTDETGFPVQQATHTATRAGKKWQPWIERDSRVRQLDAQLDTLRDRYRRVEVALRESSLAQAGRELETTGETALRLERAGLLAELGRDLEARTDYLKVLELDPAHRLALIGLGQLLVATGQRKAARLVYAEALKHYPEDLLSRVNLGAILLHEDDPAGAREHYEAALRISPEFPQAHGGLYYALARLSEPEAAEMHRRKCFAQRTLFKSLYRGESKPVPVLLLASSRGGNTPIEKLLDDRVFETHTVVTDFDDPAIPLPEHALVVNGIGDAYVAGAALAGAQSLLLYTSAQVINRPEAVLATGRCDIARRLAGVPGIITPKTITLSRDLLAASSARGTLARHGFELPLLLRTPGFHGGEHFLRVESFDDLPTALGRLPGGDLMAIQYLDARASDGKTRKYRVMMIGGQLYPLHAAVSSDWKVHYFSAEMADCPEHRAEDAEFLSNMAGVLGPRAMIALQKIEQTLGLDYGGIDFGLNAKGEVLLFETNATMNVIPPDADPRWDYRRPAVEKIYSAVLKMLVERAKGFRTKTNGICQ
jgi:tetratricopeptide (TPR) repeat protein